MSKYTTEVRYICEYYAGYDESQGDDKIDDIIYRSRAKIFDFYFPIYDETYRPVIEHKILNHYYLSEIGQETVGAWKHFLNVKMNEIMPYYNRLYRSALLDFNPFYDVDLTRDHTGSGTGKTKDVISSTDETERTAENSSERTAWEKYADTPQGDINGMILPKYITNATQNTDDASSDYTENVSREMGTTSNRDLTTTDQYLEHVRGKQGSASYSKLLQEYRDTFLNIDMMIINDLSDLFMNLW